MRAQYKISKIESKSNKNKELSNARADDNFRKILASDGLTWIQYYFHNITRPGRGTKKQERHVTSRIGSCLARLASNKKPKKKQTNKNNPAKTTLYIPRISENNYRNNSSNKHMFTIETIN